MRLTAGPARFSARGELLEPFGEHLASAPGSMPLSASGAGPRPFCSTRPGSVGSSAFSRCFFLAGETLDGPLGVLLVLDVVEVDERGRVGRVGEVLVAPRR
jgi:hypothetical protein